MINKIIILIETGEIHNIELTKNLLIGMGIKINGSLKAEYHLYTQNIEAVIRCDYGAEEYTYFRMKKLTKEVKKRFNEKQFKLI